MTKGKGSSQKIGRDAENGRFIRVKEAERRPKTTTVETIKRAQAQGPTRPAPALGS